jgi:hypothetical protein
MATCLACSGRLIPVDVLLLCALAILAALTIVGPMPVRPRGEPPAAVARC